MLRSPLRLLPAVLAVGIVLCLAILFANAEGDPRKMFNKRSSHNPNLPTPQSIKLGEAIYRKNCKQCHGDRAIRDGKSKCTSKFCPADLRNPALWQKGEDFVYQTITEGRPPMPYFKKKLSDNQRWNVVNYLHSLVKEQEEKDRKEEK